MQSPDINTLKVKNNLQTYLLWVFIFVGLFISELDPIIANDVLMFLQLIFIYCYGRSVSQTMFSKLFNLPKTVGILFIIWIGSALISLILSPTLASFHSYVTQIPRFTGLIVNLLFFYYLWHYILKQKPELEWLLLTIVIGASITALNYFLVWNLYPGVRGSSEWFSFPAFYDNVRQAGFHANAAICVLTALLFKSINNSNAGKLSAGLFVLLILMWAYLFWTGGRASSIAALMAITLLILLLMFLKKIPFHFIFLVIASIATGIILAEMFAVLPQNGLFNTLQRGNINDVNQLSSGRVYIWKQCFEILKQRWLIGTGPESYIFLRDIAGNNFVGTQPHNVFIQFWLEWGIFGAISASLILIGCFFRGFKIFIYSSEKSEFYSKRIFAFLLLVSFSITALVDGTYYHAQPVMYLLLAFGLWLQPDLQQQNQIHATISN